MKHSTIVLVLICLLLNRCGAERSGLLGDVNPGDGWPDVGGDMADMGWDVPFDWPSDAPWDVPGGDGVDWGMDGVPETLPDAPLDFLPEDTPYEDTDGDTIRDEDEGNGLVDTDGDTTPDSMDLDSDADTIPDAVEGGDGDPLSLPVDSDSDGIPDFRDSDSDNDNIADFHEGYEDADGDGILNYRDLDSDGDFVPDFMEGGDDTIATPPVDSDGDGTFDFLDEDSDGDFIPDVVETIEDTDGDTIMDYIDEDSDGDGLSDADEAGDTDLGTPPADCGDDFLPNYRDTDSDNDGVADPEEISLGTDICNPDSDGDGVTDLVEIVYGSNPLDPGDSPRERGDFVFIVPYMEDPDPEMDTLVFSTNIQHADVFFMVDTTGSMSGELSNLRSSLSSTVIPGIDAIIPDAWYGVGGHDDYPVAPYGDAWSGDRVFYLEQRTTSSVSAAQNAVNRLSIHYGYDDPESNAVALWAVATGGGLGGYLAPQGSCGAGEFGYPCFRSGSVPIVVMISDAPFHNGPSGYNYSGGLGAPAWSTTVAALVAANIKVIGVHSDTWSSDSDYRAVATATGAVDTWGNPLVYNINGNGSGLGSQVVNAVQTLAAYVPIEVSTALEDVPADAVDARIFVDRVQPNTVGGVPDPMDPMKICVGGLAVADRDGDTFPDVFTEVLPGTTVCFDIYPEMNTSVESTPVPQLYECLVHVVGDGITILDTRSIYFLIPPEIPGGN